MDIQVSRGLFSRRRNGPPRRGKVEEIMSNVEVQMCNSASYKREPSIAPVGEIIRPISRACKSCVQNSQAVIHHEYLLKGARNNLRPDTMNKQNRFYVRAMSSFVHFWNLPNLSREFTSVNPKEILEASSALLKVVFHGNTHADAPEEDLRKVLTVSRQIMEKFLSSFMAISMSNRIMNVFLRLGGWIVGKIMSAMFGIVAVHRGELDLVRIALQTGLPVIFVPLHRSHLDPFIISWALLESGLRPPLFLASHSLMRTPFLRYAAKLCGGIGHTGIRSLGDADYGYQAPGISASVFLYFALLMKKGNSVVLPVEPHRSRSGKSSSCALGREFFNVLLNLHQGKEIEDAFIIPVSVNYDILPEENILEDFQVASTTTGISASRSSNFLWNCLQKPGGIVRVGFSQPFRLREFKAPCLQLSEVSNELNIPTTTLPFTSIAGSELQWYEENGSIASLSSVYGETDILEDIDQLNHPAVDSLLHHSLYDAANGSVIMSTHVVSFLLLNKFRTGVSEDVLLNEMQLLADEIRDTYKHDVGFSGEIKATLKNATYLLGPQLVSMDAVDGIMFFKPVATKKGLVKLSYYSNHVASLFALEGALATALLSMLHPSVLANKEDGFLHSVTQSELYNSAAQICELLKTEFLLHPPCVTTLDAVADAIEKFKDNGLLRFEMKKVYNESEFDTEIGAMPETVNIVQRIDVMLNTDALKKLQFYRSIVAAYLEFYANATQSLDVLISPRNNPGFIGVEDIELRRKIYTEAEILEHHLLAPELVTHDTVRNFLSAMGNVGVVKSYASEASEFKKLFYMSDEYNSASNLNELTEAILKYCGYNQ